MPYESLKDVAKRMSQQLRPKYDIDRITLLAKECINSSAVGVNWYISPDGIHFLSVFSHPKFSKPEGFDDWVLIPRATRLRQVRAVVQCEVNAKIGLLAYAEWAKQCDKCHGKKIFTCGHEELQRS